MNKKIIIGLIIVLFFSALAISSFQATPIDPDENVTVPKGYHIVNQSDNYTLMESDKYHSISISLLEDVDKELLKHLLEKSMYDFTYVDSYDKGDYAVEENWYNQEYQRGIVYFCENGDELVVIDYKGPVSESLDDNPVGVILDGFVDFYF